MSILRFIEVDLIAVVLGPRLAILVTRPSQDAFKSNFVIQWSPESFKAKSMPVSRPRVYLIDFEVAIDFPEGYPIDQRVCVGIPTEGLLTNPDKYARQRPPETESGMPYDPFRLDVWQLGTSFADFTSREDIDEVLVRMIEPNAEIRLTAAEALDKLVERVSAVSPKARLIPPVVFDLPPRYLK
ncbi:hypothetical protein PHLGIDRAFT_122298 [Phlebiopsis gigantea 11061_1 CR5-6]|uniref:Protein kinase domain-containing protein n=1 Tax=Phlebiopsis gigantea (strain 11061_1 CR5-6) TaxID=745531 RepID=A0A0C3RRE8_PHLG1|nr:hypothetical protein PHLGIDRAFT_122298 [Phlebiopsis gigantea 11061_1 CR5-6]